MRTLAIIVGILTTVCASAAEKAKAPREFVAQILEPTGGKIQRPIGWFYTERHSLPSLYTWILSREDASKGPYTTAVRNDQGMFTRVCLETEEGPHHLLYSLFWSNNIDIVVATIAST